LVKHLERRIERTGQKTDFVTALLDPDICDLGTRPARKL